MAEKGEKEIKAKMSGKRLKRGKCQEKRQKNGKKGKMSGKKAEKGKKGK